MSHQLLLIVHACVLRAHEGATLGLVFFTEAGSFDAACAELVEVLKKSDIIEEDMEDLVGDFVDRFMEAVTL